MDVYNINSNEAKSFLKRLLGTKRCVPFLGAGFSAGEPSKRGSVPSVRELSSIMIKELATIDTFASKSGWLEKQSFFKLADYYWQNIKPEARDEFLLDRFTNVKLSNIKSKFLNCEWHNIVTLNIDDGIERANPRFKIILPHTQLKSSTYKLNDLLIKIHGDAFADISKKSEHPQVIFARRNYWESAQSNKDVLRLFSTNWKENNLLFIGCSLTEEFDLLYSLSSSNEDPYPDTSRVFFTDQKTADNTDFMTTLELDYKITHTCVVENWDDIYKICFDLFPIDSLSAQDRIESFSFRNFKTLELTFDNVIEHVLQTDKILKMTKHFEMLTPRYLIERSITRDTLQSISNETFTLIEGRRFSGQSSFLKKIAVRLQPATVYFFPSGTEISLSMLETFKFIENAYFIFDGRTINHGHLDWLLKQEYYIREKNNKVIIVSSTTDGGLSTPLIDKYGDKISFRLKQELNTEETRLINTELDDVGISRIQPRVSILNSIHSLANTYNSYKSNIFPSHEAFSQVELQFLLLLFTNEKVSSLESTYVGFSKSELNEFASRNSPLVLIEENAINPTKRGRFEVLLNCKPWCASIFNAYESTHSTEECSALVKDLINKLDNSLFGKSIFIQLIRVDNLRILFPKKHAEFIDGLFDGLRFTFKGLPDFWLQWGKAILYTRNDTISLSNSIKHVKKAMSDGSASTKRNATHTLALISGKLAEQSDFQSIPDNIMAVKSFADAICNNHLNTRYVEELKDSSTKANKQVKRLLTIIDKNPSTEYLNVKHDMDELRNFFLR